MLDLRETLRAALTDAVRAAGMDSGPEPVIVQYPPSAQEGAADYASPVALVLGKKLGKNPMDIAAAIVESTVLPEFVAAIEPAEPGFLNIRLKSEWLGKKLDDVVEEGPAFGTSRVGAGQTVNLEFVSANPTGLPTFGNGRALFWADTLANVLISAGYDVTREYYVNDVGTQVRRYGESVLRRILQAHGHTIAFPEELYQGEEVKIVAQRVEERLREDHSHSVTEADLQNEEALALIARIAVEETVHAIQEVMERVCRVKYDIWTWEHTIHERGDVMAVLEQLKAAGVTYEQDGALWFRSTQFGDDKDRVLVRNTGEVTYLVADIAYHLDKFRRGFNIVADFWGADHHGYIPRLTGALKALGQDTSRFRAVLTQMVHIVEHGEQKKISKRLGTSIPLHEVIEQVGPSAARFFLTMKALSSQMDFDLDLARSQSQQNPVFYVQYAYVRLTSVFRKAQQQNVLNGELVPALGVQVQLQQPMEHALMRTMFRFPEIVADVAQSWEVQRLPQYAFDLARSVHQFYDTTPILTADSKELMSARLTLALAAKTVLGNTLDLLGVEKREVM